MSPPSPYRTEAMPADLRARLQIDIIRQRAAGTSWLLLAALIAVAITAYSGWLGLSIERTQRTWVPMMVAAAVGVAGIVVAAVLRSRGPMWVKAALASPQVAVAEGMLQSAEILPQQARFARAARAYVLGNHRHLVRDESPGTDAMSRFVPQRVVLPAAGTPLRLVWSTAHPGHLLQVDYPGMVAVAAAPAPMRAQDWRDLADRPRAVMRLMGTLMVVFGLGGAVLPAVPAISDGFRPALWWAAAVALLWLVLAWGPTARLWLQREQVRRHTISGPVQELMWARRNNGRQGVEHALFARLGGHWHLLHTDSKASRLQTTLVPGATLTVSYAVLGDRQMLVRHSAGLI